MERRVMGNYHARCGVGENSEITSKNYLSLLNGWDDIAVTYRNGITEKANEHFLSPRHAEDSRLPSINGKSLCRIV